MRKIMRKLHLWLSVPLGLIISIICFSGALLVFEEEITASVQKRISHVGKIGNQRIPTNQLVEIVASTLPADVSVTGIQHPNDPSRCSQVMLSKPKRASVYIDPYTGEIKGKSERLPFFRTVFRLHRWLLDSQTDGKFFWGKTIEVSAPFCSCSHCSLEFSSGGLATERHLAKVFASRPTKEAEHFSTVCMWQEECMQCCCYLPWDLQD